MTETALNRRRALLLAGGVLGATTLAACGGGSDATTGTTGTTTTTGATTTTGTTTTGTTTTTTTVTGSGPNLIPAAADFVPIPGGSFTFGDGAKETITLAPYLMNRWLVTNAQYKAFTDATARASLPKHWSGGTYPAGKADHPVLWVSLNDALAFAAWVTTKLSGLTAMIPTEGQWENAARGPSGLVYPWGNTADASYANGQLATKCSYNGLCAAYYLGLGTPLTYLNDPAVVTDPTTKAAIAASRSVPVANVLSVSASGATGGWIDESDATVATFTASDQYDTLTAAGSGGYTTAVGAYPTGASPYGLFDMAGDAFEWTSSTVVAGNGVEKGLSVNGVRGGSWYANLQSCKATNRAEGRSPSGGYHSVGFRLGAVAT